MSHLVQALLLKNKKPLGAALELLSMFVVQQQNMKGQELNGLLCTV